MLKLDLAILDRLETILPPMNDTL